MTISRQTFNQVRDILRELDERISSAREERTGDSDDQRERPAGTSQPTAPGGASQSNAASSWRSV